jgi:large repetitive protein
MAALVELARAAGKHMNLPRHIITPRLRTASSPVAVRLAFFVGLCVAGAEPAIASIDNTATANGTYNGNPVVSNVVTVNVTVAPAAPALVVTKIASPDTNVTAGTLVTYTYTVRNAGNQTITNISLADTHQGSGAAPVPGNEGLTTDAGPSNDSSDATSNDGVWSVLAPGDVITLTATYTITQTDVDQKQ